METSNPMDTELSPLDQIRKTEAEVTRQVAAAREAAERMVIEARKQVKALRDDAQAAGYQQGRTHFKEIVSIAEEEAQAIVSQAQGQANALRQKGKQGMAKAVGYALSFVLGLEGEGKENEYRDGASRDRGS